MNALERAIAKSKARRAATDSKDLFDLSQLRKEIKLTKAQLMKEQQIIKIRRPTPTAGVRG